MSRGSALVLLVVFGAGVFLAGLELMITAVALPAIVTDLADWSQLRKASWIVQAYLLVYVVTMPLAGRLSDLWGARRLLLAALVTFIVGSALCGAARDLDQLIAARLVQAVGGGALVPVATRAASHPRGAGSSMSTSRSASWPSCWVGRRPPGGTRPADRAAWMCWAGSCSRSPSWQRWSA
jgi:MFS family permease